MGQAVDSTEPLSFPEMPPGLKLSKVKLLSVLLHNDLRPGPIASTAQSRLTTSDRERRRSATEKFFMQAKQKELQALKSKNNPELYPFKRCSIVVSRAFEDLYTTTAHHRGPYVPGAWCLLGGPSPPGFVVFWA